MRRFTTTFFLPVLFALAFLACPFFGGVATAQPPTEATTDGTRMPFIVSNQAGQFKVEFDIVMDNEIIWGMVGIFDEEFTTLSDASCAIVLYGPGGGNQQFLIRNAGTFKNTFYRFQADVKYHFRMEIDVDARQYAVYLTPEGESEIVLAEGMNFWTESSNVSKLNGWSIYSDLVNSVGNFTLSNMDFPTKPNVHIAPPTQFIQESNQTGQFTVEFDAMVDDVECWSVVALADEQFTMLADAACELLFYGPGGGDEEFLVRSNGNWVDTYIPFEVNKLYHFRFEVDFNSYTYDIYMTPPGEEEITIITDAGMRTNKGDVAGTLFKKVDGWGVRSDAGQLLVRNMKWPEKPNLYIMAPDGAMQYLKQTAQSGKVTIEFKAMVDDPKVWATVGIADEKYTAFNNAAAEILFFTGGEGEEQFLVRKNGEWADSKIPWQANVNYLFRFELDFDSYTYDVYMTPPGGDEITVATGAGMRTNKGGVANTVFNKVDGLGIHSASNNDGSLYVSEINWPKTPNIIINDGSFQKVILEDRTGEFTAEFDAVASSEDIWALVSLINDNYTKLADGACEILFWGGGPEFLVRSSGEWLDTDYPFSAGVKYHFRVEVDMAEQKYDVFITPQGGTEELLKGNLGLRPVGFTKINGFGTYADLESGDDGVLTVTNMIFPAEPEEPEDLIMTDGTYKAVIVSDQEGGFIAEFDAAADKANIAAVIGIINDKFTALTDAACEIMFFTSQQGANQFLVRNNGQWIQTNVPFEAKVNYHFRMEIDVNGKKYSVYVTPEGESEITLGTNLAFRPQMLDKDKLNGLGLYSDLNSAEGNLKVSNIKFTEDISVGIDEFSVESLGFEIYPNPSVTTTNVRYELVEPGDVNLKILDMQGKEVKTLVNEYQTVGSYNVQWSSNGMPRGIYLAKLTIMLKTIENKRLPVIVTKKILLTN